MRKTDLNKYANGQTNPQNQAALTFRAVGKAIWKLLVTAFVVAFITGIIVSVSLFSYVMSMKDSKIEYVLMDLKLNYTSFIYVNGENDDSGNPVQYQSLYSGENRVWVNYSDIPQAMKDAIIAIEDKRFEDHNGVDWIRTIGAVYNLVTHSKGSYGGSTITQQLIKNLTGENDVSLSRKVKEIFRALNLEKEYSKDQILEVYLNVVDFGSGCKGVQSAANLYFGKDIQDCDIAECAAIAGITQNPTAYTPLVYPEANQRRQRIVLDQMLDQEKITQEEYDAAYEKSGHMEFVGRTSENVVDSVPIWDWYTEQVFKDVRRDLMEKYECTQAEASDMIYHNGLRIYSAQNTELQTIAEEALSDRSIFTQDPGAQGGFLAMDYNGRVLATVGRVGAKYLNLGTSYATETNRQPGSSLKPLVDYAPGLEAKVINYSTILDDNPVDGYLNGDGSPGPNNYDPVFEGDVTVKRALQVSKNPPAVRVLLSVGIQNAVSFLEDKLNFSPIATDMQVPSMAIGGSFGTNIREMVGGFQIFGNGGKFYEPYTYYYVTDHDGNVILDNRETAPVQAISSVNASIMYRLLENVIQAGTGRLAALDGWQVYGKTGTTQDRKDLWFIGGTPYAVGGVWTGYASYKRQMDDEDIAKKIWKNIMSQYLSNKEAKQFTLDPDMISAKFCVETGKLENPGVCSETELGWYSRDNLPSICDGEHEGAESSEPVSSAASSEPPRVSSSEATQSGPVVVPSSSAESSEPASSENEQSSSEADSNSSSHNKPSD